MNYIFAISKLIYLFKLEHINTETAENIVMFEINHFFLFSAIYFLKLARKNNQQNDNCLFCYTIWILNVG